MSTTADRQLLPPMFQGYARSRDRVGVRNYLAIVSTVALSNRIADLASQRYELEVSESVYCLQFLNFVFILLWHFCPK